MGRRKSKSEPDIERILTSLGALFCIGLVLSGLWRATLVILAGLAVLALAIFLIIFLVRHWPRQRYTPTPIPIPSQDNTDVTCPQCKAVLVAPATMAGQKVTCEGCRHVFEIPAVAPKFPDATSFYFPPKPKGIASKLLDPTYSCFPEKPQGFTPELLRALEWKRFENLVDGYFSAMGRPTRPNRIGPDGGVDIHLLHPATNQVTAVVQCKSWHAYNVGVKPVRELFGVMAADSIPEGVFVTTGQFTNEARSWAAGKPLTLIDGHDLLNRLAALPSEKQATLHAAVTAGDYTTPTCPQCGRKMVRRQNRKTPSDDSDFWGCPSFPRCRQTFPIKKER